MNRIHRLFTAAVAVTALAACDSGVDSITPAPPADIVGSVAGTVAVEGSGVAGLTVQLGGSSAATTTTRADGSFSFPDVIAGNYVLNLADIPGDYAFPTTTQSVTIATQGQSVTADFNGSWVRTASVLVNVERADGSGAATSVRLEGEGEDQTLNTNAQGVITFTGLKAGDYTVSLPTPPEGFTETNAAVSLSTGQAAQINFVGERELLPPTITIASIVEASTGDDRERLNDINEEVLVVMDVNPNGNQMTSVEFWALEKRTGDVFRIGSQRFASTTAGPELVDGIYRAEFFFDQFDFIRGRDGSHPSIEQLGAEGFEAIGPNAMRPYHPVFADGDYEFHGVVTVAEFPGETFNAIVDVTLTEGQDDSDYIILRVEADNSDGIDFSALPEGVVITEATEEDFVDLPTFPSVLLDDDGYRWHSGDILIDAFPVIYSAPFNPNDPQIARLTLQMQGVPAVEQDEPNDDGSFSFKFCEFGDFPNTDETGECDESISEFVSANWEASVSTVTRFGQSGTSNADYWFEDLYSGTDDALRVDNYAPAPGAIDAARLPHPANAIPGVDGFERSSQTDPGFPFITRDDLTGSNPQNVPEPSCEVCLGWVTWSDSLHKIVVDPGFDADGLGIGMPGTADDQPQLMYFVGPDVNAVFGLDLAAVTAQTRVRPTMASLLSAVQEPMIGLALNTLVAADLPAETDSPGLVDAGSAAGTPLSDTELDYIITAIHWDRFGNIMFAGDEDGPLGTFQLFLGVDGLAPQFVDAEGTPEDPADPTELTSVYNTYDDGVAGPEQDFDDITTMYGEPGFFEFLDDEDAPIEGEYFGWTTDTGNGFAGVEGVVIEDWANGDGGVAGTSRFGYLLASSNLLDWTFNADEALLDNDFTIEAYVGGEIGDAYRDQRVHAFDRAGNQRIVDNVSEHIVDQSEPVIYSPSRPGGLLEFGESYTFTALAEDNVDLKRSDVSLIFAPDMFGVSAADQSGLASATGPAAEGELFVGSIFYGIAYPTPFPDGPIFVPVANIDHTAFGSDAVENEVTLSASVPMTVCFGAFNSSGVIVEGLNIAQGVGFRTWDHSSPYGRVARNATEIIDLFDPESDCGEGDGAPETGAFASWIDGQWQWQLALSDDGRPVITQAGATSTFSALVDMDDVSLYYVDIAGNLRLLDTTASDWSLNVSDTGGSEPDARTYAYTFTGTLPTDIASDEAISELYVGTVGGFTFTWGPDPESYPGLTLLWNSISDFCTIQAHEGSGPVPIC